MKIALIVLWIVCAAAFALPDSAFAVGARRLFAVLVAAHALECLVFLPRLRRAGGSLGHHLVQTFFFGIFHVRQLPA